MASLAPPLESRTLMASVVCADLVGFSKKNVADQIAIKEALARHLHDRLAPIAPEDRVVMDTGDGVAVAFLADPEHALYFALRLRLDLRRNSLEGLRSEDLRLGINLGPVKKAVDINGYANLLGEGMNSAERIMSFAAPGDTTASRSFRDAVWCLRADYDSLFEPIGRHADKHGREHEVFRMRTTPSAAESAQLSLDGSVGAATAAPAAATGAQAPALAPRHRHAWILAAATAVSVVAIAAVARLAYAPAPAASEPAAPLAIDTRPLESIPQPAAAALDPPPVLAENPAIPAAAPAPRAAKARVAPMQPAASGQCSVLLQRAALGERLRPPEMEELKTCR